jgi:hypothetical protein
MGLFLGLAGGLVLAVILTFRRTREMQASPGIEPYSDPMLADHHPDAVAGAIGQDLFMIGGTVALVLFVLAVISRAALWVWDSRNRGPMRKRSMESLQGYAIGFAIAYLFLASLSTLSMNKAWPGLYDQSASPDELSVRRSRFNSAHEKSESRMRLAWFSSFVALTVSPWARRPEKSDLQSGDGQETSD